MSAAYYRPSGRISVPRLAIVVVVSLVVAIVLAFVYAYAFAYIPIIGYVSFILAIVFGFAIGGVVTQLAKVSHVRSNVATIVITLLATVVGYYVSWAVWLHAIAGRGDVDVQITTLASSPGLMWDFIKALNESGVWSMHGWTPKGGVLWLFWGLELLLIFVPAVMAASNGLGESVYCESCGRWCTDRFPVGLGIADTGEMAQRLAAGDLQALAELPPRGPEELVWTRVDVKLCPTQGCGQTNTLSVSTVMLVVDDEGNTKEKADRFVDRMLIDRATAEHIGLEQRDVPAETPSDR